ncbi:MAG: outer membrane protein assembly factor BamD [Rhodospirillales bacterium]|nr:outer membrane protein assembly factor BamD [Rhodospirillales bacterium]
MSKISGIALALGVALALGACGSTEKLDTSAGKPVQAIYNEAVNALEAKNYNRAAKLFDDVEREHPYSVWATKAQLMAGYSHYQAGQYDEAVIAIDRFIQLHPGNRDVAYAHYLKALSYYEQISDVVRDQGTTENARSALTEVVRRFPNTRYARDAKLKLDLTQDHLAGKEMEIGRYYLKRAHYLAAINRFRRVVDNYQTTSHVPEALHRLVESYSALGIEDEARKAAAVLGHNFPGSEWYIDSYTIAAGEDVRKKSASKQGFLTRAWDWVF